ncbi:APC family permease [Ferrimicrobium acidiphilum]|uniref:APC family permease n=1 Tax=Ferrimicrobium acidiphilum TaxID=121039 RepID=UPI0023F14EB2|nr:APC family permease [Ferrimicrobium acidiphilum]MCL5053138.1 APC family permease [Gammaproteobacteria bacterium]
MSDQLTPQPTPAQEQPRKMRQVFGLLDLFPLSISSIGPVFSVAATGGVMAADAGWWALPAIAILAIPFIIASFVFRLLNRHFPNSGASYHWSSRVMGRRVSQYQAWILILAYFFSIPPIAIPAATYTLALVAPHYHPSNIVTILVTIFWVAFAAVPLLLGSKPTAQITKAFFALEMVSLIGFGILGLSRLHATSVGIHFGALPVGGMLVVAVVAATILDGWEIDSYAAEESEKPRQDPGISGIVGAFLALVFYAILYPLIFSETPMKLLASHSDADPLALWAQRVLPSAHWVILVPILASTAGGLWLTTYILTRALYSMGREQLIPQAFGKLSKRHVPHIATLAVLSLTLVVVAVQLFVSSLGSFFNLVLSAAGFFLLAEFFFDILTAVIFLTVGHKKLPDVQFQPHQHRWLLIGAIFSGSIMGALLVAFFIYGPRAIGVGIDQTLVVLLLAGVLFVLVTLRRVKRSYIFDGNNADSEQPLPEAGSSSTGMNG